MTIRDGLLLEAATDVQIRGASRGQDKRYAKPAVVLLALLLFPLLVVVAFFATLSLLPRLGDLGSLQGQFGGGTRGLYGLNGSLSTVSIVHITTAPAPFAWPSISIPGLSATLVAEALLAAGIALIVVVGVRRFRGSKPGTPPFHGDDPLTSDRQKVASILDAAASRLGSETGHRETVLRCYRAISGVLARRSEVDGRTMTAREFMAAVSERLRFDSPYLLKATRLFEVARYSEVEITRDQALEASDCLSNLSASLKETVPPS